MNQAERAGKEPNPAATVEMTYGQYYDLKAKANAWDRAEADIERLRADYTTVRDAVLGHQPRDWSAREVAALAAAHRSDSEDRDAQEALRASHVAPSDPKSDDETCARCSHPRLWHAGNGREMGECQVHSGCSCYEFLAPVAGHAAPAPPARKVQRDVVMTAIRTCCREKRFGLIGREIDALTQAIVDAYAEPSGEPAAPPSEKGKP